MYVENCALLGYYAASSGNMLLTFRTTSRSYLPPWKVGPIITQKSEVLSEQ